MCKSSFWSYTVSAQFWSTAKYAGKPYWNFQLQSVVKFNLASYYRQIAVLAHMAKLVCAGPYAKKINNIIYASLFKP